MPKTYGNLWSGLVSWENLYEAYIQASRGKRYRPAALSFRNRLEENLVNIQNHLIWGSWRPSAFRAFTVYEPKKRLIMAPPFKDRVVHHALVQVIGPLFERKFVHDSYACRPGKGMHSCAMRVQSHMRRARRLWGSGVYVLKGDIAGYFPSVPADTLKRLVRRTIRDRRVLDLCDTIIDHGAEAGRGIPVGALTSQLWANMCLDQADHLAKDSLGIRMYVRYMDDWLVVGPSKGWCWDQLAAMSEMIVGGLGLAINPKTDVVPASHGVDFCGYRIWRTHMLPRKRNVKRAKERFRALSGKCRPTAAHFEKVRPVVASFLGYMKHCQSRRTTISTLNHLVIGG